MLVEKVCVLFLVQVCTPPIVHPLVQQGFGPGFYIIPIQALGSAQIPLELDSRLFKGLVLFHPVIKVAFRMGQNRLVSLPYQPADFVQRDKVPHLRRIMNWKFNQNMITLPGKQPVSLPNSRPGIGNQAVLHRRNQFQRYSAPIQFGPKQLASCHHGRRGISVQGGSVRGTNSPPVSPLNQFPGQENSLVQRLCPVINSGENMTMTIYLHSNQPIRNMASHPSRMS